MRTVIGMAVATAAAALMVPALAQAQAAKAAAWPQRPVTVIMPVSPGVAADIEARAYTDKLGEVLGQPFVRDYKPGAGTMLSLNAIARANPDGYTLGMANINLAFVPLKFADAPFDYIKSFEYVSLVARRINGLFVSTALPITNMKEYIAYAKAHPGEMNFTANGEGSTDHITGSWISNATGTKVTFIHYKDSKAQQVDLMAGRTHLISVTYSEGGSANALIKAGKMRPIGTIATQRSPLAPDVPTMAEQGIKDVDAPSFLGMLAPAKTAASIVNRLHDEIVKIAKLPETQKAVGAGTVLSATTGAEFRTYVQNLTEKYRKVVKDNNINMKEE